MHLQVQIKWNFCCDLISCALLKILIKIEISLNYTILKSKNVMSYYRCKFKWGKRPFVVKQRTFSNLHHLLTWQVETHTHNARTFSYNKHEKRDTHTPDRTDKTCILLKVDVHISSKFSYSPICFNRTETKKNIPKK